MRYFRRVSLVLLFVVFIIGCSTIWAQTPSETVDKATIEIVRFDEPIDEYITYKAVLTAPVGTKLDFIYGLKATITSEERTFLLAHRLYNKTPNPAAGSPGGSSVDSVVDTYFYTMNGGSIHNKEIVIPGSTTHPEYPVESYIDIIEPGTYEVEEGGTLVFARVADVIFDMTITDIP